MKTRPYSLVIRHLLALSLMVSALPAAAWSNHALGSWQALSGILATEKTAGVRAESLESFLQAEARSLEQVLQQEEQWAKANVTEYPQQPGHLSFRAGSDARQNRQRLTAALRINPHAKLPLYLQLQPGADINGKTLLSWKEVTTLQHSLPVMNAQFVRLQEGETVAPLDVVASASDEPDYGLDLGLWNDNVPDLGYGFGKQPFGNPALEYSTQAPFHMGFFHESAIIYKAARFLRRTYPEYRIHLYQSLSAHAFCTGHAYWGWRFAGWALHYVQDLTQPYHATVLPGVSVSRMLWINALDILGAHGSKQQVITLVSNRHAALENYQYRRMRSAYLRKNKDDALLLAARTSGTAGISPYTPGSVRRDITQQSHAAAAATDAALEQLLPAKYISDPGYILGETEANLDLFSVLNTLTPAQQTQMTALVSGLMQNFGMHTRSFLQSIQPLPDNKKN